MMETTCRKAHRRLSHGLLWDYLKIKSPQRRYYKRRSLLVTMVTYRQAHRFDLTYVILPRIESAVNLQ